MIQERREKDKENVLTSMYGVLHKLKSGKIGHTFLAFKEGYPYEEANLRCFLLILIAPKASASC